jgi:hypothetical protein
MTVKRQVGWLATTLLTVSLLGACGGSDDDPAIKPVTDAPSSTATAADPDGFTPAQREVADAVQAYTKAFYGRGTESVADAAAQFVTPDLIDFLRAGEKQILDDGKFQYLGEAVVRPEEVTISGDTAEFRGCSDGSQAAIVPVGETKVKGRGARIIGYTKLSYGLIRSGDRWLVSDPKGEPVASC